MILRSTRRAGWPDGGDCAVVGIRGNRPRTIEETIERDLEDTEDPMLGFWGPYGAPMDPAEASAILRERGWEPMDDRPDAELWPSERSSARPGFWRRAR